jgi:hypothetical protein
LHYLGVVFDEEAWKERAINTCLLLHQTVERHPGSFGVWAMLMQAATYGVVELAIVGDQYELVRNEVLRRFIPFRVVQSSPSGNDDFPLLANKPRSANTLLYLCKNYECQSPVNKVSDLIPLLENV